MDITTPKKVGPMVAGLCQDITGGSPIYVDVDPQEQCRHGWCFADIEALVTREGGQMVTGWIIWEARLQHAQAEHHAIWERPDGTLVDPIPKPDGETSILFLPDPDATWDGGDATARPSRYRANALSRLAKEWVKLVVAEDAITRSQTAGWQVLTAEELTRLDALQAQRGALEARMRKKSAKQSIRG